MVDQEQLRERALRAYELGRLRMSSRVLLFLLPLSTVCVLLSETPRACAWLALLTVGLAVALRWLDRRGVHAVDMGLKSGTLPLLVCIALMQLGSSSNPTLCTTVCIAAGTLAGAWMGYELHRRQAGIFVWFASASVALIFGALGSLELGLVVSFSLAAAYIVSSAVVAVLLRSRMTPQAP
ncbi:hypothetical protein HNQ60_003839 [Povalibacter uvarum]|uniref:Uncharacterized protein n=1 Tax=Povalibacter uvarum TaxID=732238 RepID=A0A841HSG5_9GAMM|nr:hypothetical protein [Povalibacter uvarum]MBB6094952.1 hypothetical protein [Povalibacter uvarum]